MFKNPSFLFDIICTVVWLLLAVRYARKGFLASVVQLAGSLFSLTGARAFSGWAAGQVFQNFFAGSFRDQIAASITAGGVVDLSGIAQRYAGFLPESFRASIVEACERSVSAVLSDNAVVLADVIVQKVLAPLLCSLVRPGGNLVLAGILARQADELIEAYAPWVALQVSDEEDGWILMTAVKS